MQLVRVAAVALVWMCALGLPATLAPGRTAAALWTVAFAVLAGLAQLATRLVPGWTVVVSGAMLLLDGAWLSWLSYVTGGTASPLRYAILLHVAAVALLASYRTAVKLAVWFTLLLLLLRTLVLNTFLDATAPRLQGSLSDQQLLVFVIVLWLVAVSTSALSAVNERELRRRRGDLEVLSLLAEEVKRTSAPESIAHTLMDTAASAFDVSRGVVLASSDGTLRVLASHGLQEEIARRPGRPGGSAVIARAHDAQSTVLVRELDDKADAWLVRLMPGARNLIVVPLSAGGRPIGALVTEHTARPRVARRIVSALERASAYAALELRNAWLLEQAQRLAATDGLTKIANRRTFESTLEREVARATRTKDVVSLVMLDIDHFKVLNDTYGHQAGDEVLRNVAFALSCECRDFDTPARYGGEEFAVVLPGCGPEQAHRIAERLRRSVSAAPAVATVTASAGVATYPVHASDSETLVRAADDALYRSKHDGRDRTSSATCAMPADQVQDPARVSADKRGGSGGEQAGPTVSPRAVAPRADPDS